MFALFAPFAWTASRGSAAPAAGTPAGPHRQAWSDSGLVFTQEDGQAIRPEVASRLFRQALKKTMRPTIRLHDLRHTHATLACAGIHPEVVSERLGHVTASITLDTYSHAIPATQEEAAALIAGLVLAQT